MTNNNLHIPRVSFGIPVYNGENFLAKAIDSILAQTLTDYEIVISDNASNDATQSIAESYARRDDRVRYSRNKENIGLSLNWTRVFDLSRGEYFKWMPHDDLLDPKYLERCVAVLDGDPSVVNCHTKVAIIDPSGSVIDYYDVVKDTDAREAHVRFLALLQNEKCFEEFGLVRRNALAKLPSPLYAAYGNSDGVLLARLGLLGRFYQIPEYLLLNREHPARVGHIITTYRQYTQYLSPGANQKLIFPRWRMLKEFLWSIKKYSPTSQDRIRCYGHMATWCRWYWKGLLANVAFPFYDWILRSRPKRINS